MKSRMSIVLAVMIALGLAGTLALRAQTHMTKIFEFETSFDFKVGNTHLSAGHYIVSRLGSNWLVVKSRDGKANAMESIMSTVEAAESPSKLMFNKYGEVYFLSEVRLQRDHHHQTYRCYKSKAEKTLSANQGAPEVVTVIPIQ